MCEGCIVVPVRPRVAVTLDQDVYNELAELADGLGLTMSALSATIIKTRLPAVRLLLTEGGRLSYAELVSRLRQ